MAIRPVYLGKNQSVFFFDFASVRWGVSYSSTLEVLKKFLLGVLLVHTLLAKVLFRKQR